MRDPMSDHSRVISNTEKLSYARQVALAMVSSCYNNSHYYDSLYKNFAGNKLLNPFALVSKR